MLNASSWVFLSFTGHPSLRIEKNDLKSVTLLEAKVKVKDIAVSRERVTLQDVLHEGTFLSFCYYKHGFYANTFAEKLNGVMLKVFCLFPKRI